MESCQDYAVVATDNGQISAIPLKWLLNKHSLIFGQRCEWFFPTKCMLKKSIKYDEAGNYWNKESGCFLNVSDSYMTANFLVIAESLKIKKFVIVELMNANNLVVIVPCSSIVVNHELKQFTCRLAKIKNGYEEQQLDFWGEYNCIPRKYYDTFNEAKSELHLFDCTTEVQNENNKRKHSEKNYLNSSDSRDNSSENSNMTKKKSKSVNINDLNLNDMIIYNTPQSQPIDASRPLPETTQNNNVLQFQSKVSNEKNGVSLLHNADYPDKQSLNNYNIPVLDNQVPSTEDFERILMSILLSVQNTTSKILELRHITQEIMADVINNRNIINSLYSKLYPNSIVHTLTATTLTTPVTTTTSITPITSTTSMTLNTPITTISHMTPILPKPSEKMPLNEPGLKFPIKSIEDLITLDTNELHKRFLIQMLIKNRKYDVRHTTYQMMKLIMDNKVACSLNMSTRKVNKLCLLDMELYDIIVGCIRYFYPEEPLSDIKKYIGDWIRQAPARRQHVKR